MKLNAALATLLLRKQAQGCLLVILHQERKAEIFAALREDAGLKPENVLLDVAVELESGRMKTESAAVNVTGPGAAAAEVTLQSANN